MQYNKDSFVNASFFAGQILIPFLKTSKFIGILRFVMIIDLTIMYR